jgi:DNA-binding NtrC family response regulator
MAVMETAKPFIDGAGQKSALVFIVDDEILIGEVVEAILSLEGFECHFYADPETALREIEEGVHKPDLLLSDYVMKPINGMELIQRAKSILPNLKTILISGNVGQEITMLYPFKPDLFVRKPFLPKNLVQTVQRVLRG